MIKAGNMIVSFIEAMSERSGRWIAWLFLCTVLAVFYEVFGRYFFNAPSIWGFEVSLYSSAIAIVVSGAYCTKHRSHIAMGFLQEVLSKRARLGLDIFNLAFAGIVCGVMSWATAEWGWNAFVGWQRTGSVWNPPAPALLKPLIPLVFALMCMQNFVNIWKRCSRSDENDKVVGQGQSR